MYHLQIDGDSATVTVGPPATFGDLARLVGVMQAADVAHVTVKAGSADYEDEAKHVDWLLYTCGFDCQEDSTAP